MNKLYQDQNTGNCAWVICEEGGYVIGSLPIEHFPKIERTDWFHSVGMYYEVLSKSHQPDTVVVKGGTLGMNEADFKEHVEHLKEKMKNETNTTRA